MSRKQWGHGYYTAKKKFMKETQTQGPFPVGYFFHSRDKDGKIERQGIVISASGDLFLVKYFNWLDGGVGEEVTPFKVDDMKTWSFYQTDNDMRMAYYKENRFSEDDVKAGERLVNLFKD